MHLLGIKTSKNTAVVVGIFIFCLNLSFFISSATIGFLQSKTDYIESTRVKSNPEIVYNFAIFVILLNSIGSGIATYLNANFLVTLIEETQGLESAYNYFVFTTSFVYFFEIVFNSVLLTFLFNNMIKIYLIMSITLQIIIAGLLIAIEIYKCKNGYHTHAKSELDLISRPNRLNRIA